jgi:hypothetical protein
MEQKKTRRSGFSFHSYFAACALLPHPRRHPGEIGLDLLGGRAGRVELQVLGPDLPRLFRLLQVVHVDHPEVVEALQMLGIYALSLLEVGDRLVIPADLAVHDPLVGQGVHVLWLELEHLGVGVHRLLRLVGVEIVVGELIPDLGVLRILGDDLLGLGYPSLVIHRRACPLRDRDVRGELLLLARYVHDQEATQDADDERDDYG